ncbi:bifunctional 2-C-methyl-D-erythritol 4-phosphate cytidylyltransferase/2-C-methyl-D-erythritol 2,4-cyclodiphosphate synthase [Helicobacter sp. 13S00477-4]|nr:bifunctional 2-C-methyl-D-erythritol 4-phosphate cytidylyltransferase/2-C-methyl-D-erythritol 2,4-cyclodiphosphate synthase [Helicobacter sp. 13S00477-4]
MSLIITAAGNSTRFCSHLPPKHRIKKQWLRIGQIPLWQKVADDWKRFYDFEKIILVVSKEDFDYVDGFYDYDFVVGGDNRTQSVRNALQYVQTPLVLVSDVARWNLDEGVYLRLLDALDDISDCIAPYLQLPDTIMYGDHYIDRDLIKIIQTPQLCRTEKLKFALLKGDFTDESSAIKALGGKITYVKGSQKLSKLTYQDDMIVLRELQNPSVEIFVGNGFDIHPFEAGKKMLLGGVVIESDLGFKAHSDGDVVLHALTDAILGAIGGGDIGEWFPDTDQKHKNADSKVLLKQVYDFAISIGFELVNADITIIAQTPKIASYKSKIRQNIATMLHMQNSRINIKATTTENLGFIGRKEGVAVSVSVNMKFINWKEEI